MLSYLLATVPALPHLWFSAKCLDGVASADVLEAEGFGRFNEKLQVGAAAGRRAHARAAPMRTRIHTHKHTHVNVHCMCAHSHAQAHAHNHTHKHMHMHDRQADCSWTSSALR